MKTLKAAEILKNYIHNLQEMEVTLAEAITVRKLEKEAEEALAELTQEKSCEGCKHENEFVYLDDHRHTICDWCNRNPDNDHYTPKG